LTDSYILDLEGGGVSKTAGLHAMKKRKLQFGYTDFLGSFFAWQ